MKKVLANEATVFTDKQMEELSVLRSTNFPVKELYCYLFRVKLNTTETIKHAIGLSNRVVIREDPETLVVSSSYRHVSGRQQVSDEFLVWMAGRRPEKSEEDESEKLQLNAPKGCDGIYPGHWGGILSLMPLAHLNIWCQKQKGSTSLKPRLCVQEGLCCYDEVSKQYKIFFSMQGFRRLHNQCAEQVQQEHQVAKLKLNHMLNHDIILTYEAVGLRTTGVKELKAKLQGAMKVHELEVERVLIGESTSKVTLFCSPAPNWRFSEKQCRYQTKDHDDVLGCTVKSFCTRLETLTGYCEEHFNKTREINCSSSRDLGREELRERLMYTDRPTPMIKPILQFVMTDENGNGEAHAMTLQLKSMQYEPKKSQKNHLKGLEKISKMRDFLKFRFRNF
jgi:hypothetical protein